MCLIVKDVPYFRIKPEVMQNFSFKLLLSEMLSQCIEVIQNVTVSLLSQ